MCVIAAVEGKAQIDSDGKRFKTATGKVQTDSATNENCCCAACLTCVDAQVTLILAGFDTNCFHPHDEFRFTVDPDGTYGPEPLVDATSDTCTAVVGETTGEVYDGANCTSGEGPVTVQIEIDIGPVARAGIGGASGGEDAIRVRMLETSEHIIAQILWTDAEVSCDEGKAPTGTFDLPVYYSADQAAYVGPSITVIIEPV